MLSPFLNPREPRFQVRGVSHPQFWKNLSTKSETLGRGCGMPRKPRDTTRKLTLNYPSSLSDTETWN